MEFTRQPIIETVISAKEGFKLVVRSSKAASQEEYFVDAVEVVSFGNALFFRSTEKPKAFLAPVTDYEVLEVREARMVLKNVGLEKAIKIGGGKETMMKAVREPSSEEPSSPQQERTVDRKRDRRRGLRRRRGEREEVKESQDEEIPQEGLKEETALPTEETQKIELPEPKKMGRKGRQAAMELSSNVLKSLLTPPPNLISDTIEKYRDDDLFKGVFISKEAEMQEAQGSPQGEQPHTPYTISDSEEEAIFRKRVVAKEHESEHFSEGLEEGPSAVVESFQEDKSTFDVYTESFPLYENKEENSQHEEPENKI